MAKSRKKAKRNLAAKSAYRFQVPNDAKIYVNLTYKAGGVGNLGAVQLEWLERDVAGLPSGTPIVVFAHVPLWAVYPLWGWVTDDAGRSLGYLLA